MASLGEAVLDLTANEKPLMDGIEGAKPKFLAALDGLGLIGGQILAAGIGLAVAGLTAVGGFLASSIGPASDLNETVSKVTVVFGENADAVLAWGETTAEGLGMSSNAALTAAGTYGNLFRAMGMNEDVSSQMSTSLVELAGDLASFNNMDPTEVLDKLRAGLVGESEPLKSLGVNINEVLLKEKAMEMGLWDGVGTLDAASKAQASYALIMEQTTLAQGDFARTSKGLANQQRILAAKFEDIRAKVGTALLPVITELATTLSDYLARPEVIAFIQRFTEGVGNLAQKALAALPAVIQWFKDAVSFLQNNQDVVVVILAVIGAAIAAFAYTTVIPAALAILSALAPILLIMAAVAAIAWVVYQAWTNNWGGIRDAVMQFWATVQPYFQMLVQWLQTNIPIAIQGLSNFWNTVLMPALQAFFGFLAEHVLPALGDLVTWLGTNIPIAVASVQKKLVELQARFVKFVDGVKDVVKFVSEKIVGAFDAAAKVIGNVISMIQGLINKFKELAEKVPDIFTPGSPTPFETGMWGINDALKAVAKTTLPALGGSFDANLAFAPATLAAGSIPAAGGGAGTGNQYTFNMLSTELDEDQLIRALQRAEMLYG